MRQLISSARLTQRIKGGLPSGIPGIGLEMEGAIQQAPQFLRHVIFFFSIINNTLLRNTVKVKSGFEKRINQNILSIVIT